MYERRDAAVDSAPILIIGFNPSQGGTVMNKHPGRVLAALAASAFLFASGTAVAGGRHAPRDIDRALLITDIVLRALSFNRVIVTEPFVSYSSTVYAVPNTTIHVTPHYIPAPVVVTPRYYYPHRPPQRPNYYPSPRHKPSPPSYHRGPSRGPSKSAPGRGPGRSPSRGRRR